MEPAELIELRAVSKAYGTQPVLDSASLQIASGTFVAIVGRSGSGKSTLLRLIGGLESADDGAVIVAGRDLKRLDESERARLRRSEIGFVFQFFNLIPTLTVAENVELPLALNDVPRHEANERCHALWRELGVAACADRFPEELSGGEQQRTAIARAVVHEPQVVLADEPTGNLDLETAQNVMELLHTTCRRRGSTLVMATHSRDVEQYADRVVAIRAGRITEAQR
jgi:putative ABC transport system ATP-binding protein